MRFCDASKPSGDGNTQNNKTHLCQQGKSGGSPKVSNWWLNIVSDIWESHMPAVLLQNNTSDYVGATKKTCCRGALS